MIDFLKRNAQFVIFLVVWVAMGMLFSPSAFLLVPLGFMVLKSKGRYTEIIIAFEFILCMADSYHAEMDWARDIKDVALLMISLFVFLNTREFKHRSKLFMPFIMFLAFCYVPIIRSPEPLIAFEKIFAYSLLLIAVPNYFLKLLDEQGEEFLRSLIWFFTTFLFLGFIYIYVAPEWVYRIDRYSGLMGNPNGIGSICTLLVILIAVIRSHYPDLFSKYELYFIYSCIFISVVLSSSRNCIFSLLIFLFFIRFYRISYLSGFSIVIVSALVFQFVNEHLVTIITSLGLGDYLRVNHLDDGSGRIVAWRFAWDEIQRNFFIGRGFGYDQFYFSAHKAELLELGHFGGVHNSYLCCWLNSGIIGLILFLVGFFTLFFKAARVNYLAIPAMFAIMFSITFESWATSSLSPFTIVFLLIITLLQYKKHEKPAEENTVSLH